MNLSQPSQEKLTTKEIARLAGVSVGTVDRVIHNRGQVAQKTRDRIQAIINEHGYEPNLYARNLVKNQTYTVAAILPWSDPNDYWHGVDQGIQKAIQDFKSRNLNILIENYSFAHPQSMLSALRALQFEQLDGLILSPSTPDITLRFIEEIQQEKPELPFIFIDSHLPDMQPEAFFIQHAYDSGYLAARLIHYGVSHLKDPRIVLLKDDTSNRRIVEDRMHGFQDFFKEHQSEARLEFLLREDISRHLMDAEGWDIHGLFIPNSRAHRILESIPAQTLKQKPKIVGYDLTPPNLDYLRFGMIDFLINQNPEAQAYQAVNAFHKRLVLEQSIQQENYLPLEIITRENMEYRSNNLLF